MGNLIRPANEYLINAIASSTTDVEVLQDAVTGRNLFVFKPLGLVIPGNVENEAPIMKVNIMPGAAGTKKVSTVNLIKTYNPNKSEYEFTLILAKKADWSGFSNDVFDGNPRVYTYVKKNFSTSSAGTFDAEDTTDILKTLVDYINADVKLYNAENTGSPCTAELVAADAGVPAYIKLTAVDGVNDFTLQADMDEFAINAITGVPAIGVKAKGSWESMARKFAIKEHSTGQYIEQPIKGKYYTTIEITLKSTDYNNVTPSGLTDVEQKYILYTPNEYAEALTDPIVAALKTAAINITKNGVAWTE